MSRLRRVHHVEAERVAHRVVERFVAVQVLTFDRCDRQRLLVAAAFAHERTALVQVDRPRACRACDGLAGLGLVARRKVGVLGERDFVERDEQVVETHLPAVDEQRISVGFRRERVAS